MGARALSALLLGESIAGAAEVAVTGAAKAREAAAKVLSRARKAVGLI